jgi:hypothetical protein
VKEYSHNNPLKSRKSFGKKRKHVRKIIKNKMASFLLFANPMWVLFVFDKFD